MCDKQVAEAVERLSYVASCPEERWLSGPQDTSASGVVVKRADLNTTLSALAEARSEVERLKQRERRLNEVSAMPIGKTLDLKDRAEAAEAERDTLAAQLNKGII